MSTTSLGRLEPVELRTVWTGEATDFTPWLAREDNLKLLADTIALDLELDEVEKGVGPFRADIVCKETVTNHWVLIENQIERTDHSHLGQLLTYAAGLDAVTIVWIASRFTDEHRATLDWLNEITDDAINFFGLEIELWRIGDSQIAPKFNIVSKPNDWIKTVTASRQSSSGGLTPTRQMQLEYWTAFKQFLEDRGSALRPQKPYPQNWSNFALGRSGIYLSALLNTQKKRIAVQLTMDDDNSKAYFHLLHREQKAIESEIGKPLEWRALPKRKQSSVILFARYDPNNRDQWPEQHAWLCDTLERFHKALSWRVKALDVDDYVSDDAIHE